jgi:hypothetical protein
MHPDGILSAEALRSIPVGRIEAAANAQLHPTATGAGGDVDVPAGATSTLPDDLRETAVPGYPDAFYVAVAASTAGSRPPAPGRWPTWPATTRCRSPPPSGG